MFRIKGTAIIVYAIINLACLPTARGQEALTDFKMSNDSITTAWTDSLYALKHRFETWKYEGSDTLSNPYYSPLFSAQAFSTNSNGKFFAPKFYNTTRQQKAISFNSIRLYNAIGNVVRHIYGHTPWLVSMFGEDNTLPEINTNKKTEKTEGKFSQEIKREIDKDYFITPEIDIDVIKPNFWTLKANFSFQLMQNYVTDNWYKGGESNHALLGQLIAEANYDNKRQIKFNNKLEMRLGFQSSNSDDIHKYKTNSDLIRLTNEFSIKAFKHWDYSAMLQSWTQFYRGYKKNDPHVYSDFMSPFESLLTLGLKYSLKKKNFEIAINISPLALDFKYVGRPSLIRAMGLEEGKHSKFEYGSNITATHKWTLFKNIVWSGRFYYYTSYKRTQIEWENTFHLKVNKYLSTQIFLYPRFDDGVKRPDAETSYFQFKEYLSIGLDVDF